MLLRCGNEVKIADADLPIGASQRREGRTREARHDAMVSGARS
jgi:hypothetical protein